MKRPEQAIKWLTDKGVLSNTRKDLLDYITKLEADSKRLDKLERLMKSQSDTIKLRHVYYDEDIFVVAVGNSPVDAENLRVAIDKLEEPNE